MVGYNSEAFITKLTSSGNALTYSTYLGGSSSDWGNGIAVDGSGNVYVTGATQSSDFPTQNPYQGIRAGSSDAFITKLSETAPASLYVSKSGECGGKSPCYDSIQGAIGAAGIGAVIFIRGETYSESILLNESKALHLKGGWNTAFTTQSSYTTVNSMTIRKGTAAVESLVIQ